jgi:hypothetical protein
MSEILNGVSPWDMFFYYGKIDLESEVVYDLYELLLQPKRSMFYFRDGAGGITEFENYPSGIQLLLMKFQAASAIANRNECVSNGDLSLRDRRVATSQEFIDVDFDTDGNVTIGVRFFLYADYQSPKSANLLLKN